MKSQTLAFILLFTCSCSSPYINPQTSKAISEQEQLEELKKQNQLLIQQNIQLKRIADAIEQQTRMGQKRA